MTNEIQIYKTKIRTKCPLYGFAYAIGNLIDSEGNQCAIITDRYSPCRMEILDQEICWKDCRFNSKESASNIEKILEFTIFPNELMPKGAPSWKGIPLRNWYEHIVNGKNI